MGPNAFERDKCSCFRYCYLFTGLGKLLSNPKTRCRLAPTCMFHVCISPPVMWRQKKAVRSEAFVVDSESCETYLEGDQTIKISSQAEVTERFRLPTLRFTVSFWGFVFGFGLALFVLSKLAKAPCKSRKLMS